MLMSESLRIGELVRQAMADRYGEAELSERFRAFDTICSATQERQDAVVELLNTRHLDLAVVIGGYNSSNTCNLARICADRTPTYHIADPDCLVSATEIRHRPIGPAQVASSERTTRDWLPAGEIQVALTAGASTPNNIVGRVIERLGALAAS
jgi:4-hydroxy-3-methylbut-2-enyl diphosphate reductase